MEDKELIQQCLGGAKGAWETFLLKYSPLIFSLVHKCLQRGHTRYSDQDAEDILENTILALLEDDFKLLHDYDPSYRFSTWLGVIVRTQVGRFQRKRKDRVVSLEDLQDRSSGEGQTFELKGKGEDPSLSSADREEVELLRMALEQLKFKEKLILTLAFFDEKDYKEISEIMDVSINSVGAYLFRAKSKLAKVMKKLGGGE